MGNKHMIKLISTDKHIIICLRSQLKQSEKVSAMISMSSNDSTKGNDNLTLWMAMADLVGTCIVV